MTDTKTYDYDVTVTVTYKVRVKASNAKDAAKRALWNPSEECYESFDDVVVNGYYENFPYGKLIYDVSVENSHL